MAVGGEQKRKELFNLVSQKYGVQQQMENMTLSGNTRMNDEEAKVAMYGDKDQGDRMARAKAQKQSKRTK